MKSNRPILLAVLLFFSFHLSAQTNYSLLLKSGTITTEKNISQSFVDSFNQHFNPATSAFLVVQFETIPTEESRKILSANGMELLEYIPNLAYTISVTQPLKLNILQLTKARSVNFLTPQQKMESRLSNGNIPAWASKVGGTIDVWISFPKNFSTLALMDQFRKLNIDIISSQYSSHRILAVRIAANRLEELASLPIVEFVQLAPRGDQALLNNSRSGSRANLLNASVANGGKGLNGEGVTVGVGDNADVQTNIDFAQRLINRSPMPVTSGHGHHVTGIVAGSGAGNEMYRGYASKATIVSQGFNGIIWNAPTYVNDYDMVVTNNSYGDNIECDYYGTYDLYSRVLDQMAFDLPLLQNVFSAGNSGLNTCAPFAPNYHTVLGGYQSAKNVLTVGATNDSGEVASFSSRGPVRDGRTKPEIVAMGQLVASNWSNNLYGFNNGTSMSGPAAAGGLVLMIQRYRQLNGGANPKNGLMKAIISNGSSDRGNMGPDYQYGYGWMNLLRSIDMIENQHYINTNVAVSGSNDHTINIPAGTAQLKVMLYWNDPAASPLSAKTLVNDLDLEVINTSGAVVQPNILDTTNAGLPQQASVGVDRLNNMEQVVINDPSAGNYSFRVKGTAITQNPSQEYFLVYDIIPVQLKITSPAGGEAWHPTSYALERSKVSWESYGYTGTVTIEFSADNGNTWSTLANNIDINRNVYTLFVPEVVTSQARIRIVKEGSGESTTSEVFTIIGRPKVTLAPVQCEGYISINWTAVAGATDYQVMIFKGDEMKAIDTTTATSYTYSGLSKDSVYWVTVMPRINGKGGKRAAAISRQPNTGTCAGNISNNDLKIDAILAPASGRRFTSTQLTNAVTISARIKNLDDAASNNFSMKYSVNDGPFISENVTTTINAAGLYVHHFSAPADMSALGEYKLVVVVKNLNADPVSVNDTAAIWIRHLDNQPVDIGNVFIDNMETAVENTYQGDSIGLRGIDRYDFSRSTIYGRLRTFINSGIAYSGSKALTLDASRYYPAGNTNYLQGTYNLVNYNALAHDVRLDFRFNNHGQYPHNNNKVWIRGNDSQPWIEVYDLDDKQEDPGIYKRSSSIELGDILVANGQSFGTSFQVRWGQWGQIAATDKMNAGGYSFDDVRLYEVFNDMQMISIDTPVISGCALTNAQPVRITVRNSANTVLNNVPVKYRVNNGAWINETIASIAANETIQYTFNGTSNLSALGSYTIEALVDYGADSFRENDTVSKTVINSPVINVFPYLEGFETGNGSWYAGGKNSSWEYGTPQSNKISKAANGTKAWKTRLQGSYNDKEFSYLYSPCYDISGITNPTLSFSLALDIEDCGNSLCDGAWIEYSEDGVTWTKLGAAGQGTNWYNKATDQLWSTQNFTRWRVATTALPAGLSKLRLRFVMESDPAANREGIAIDDIHIYDKTYEIYDGITMAAPETKTVAGNSQVDFTSNNKIVASILPKNQLMGATAVQAFINTGAVRNTGNQYYHDRNITIKPTNTLLSDSVTVRFYFLETEVDTLIKATGCAACENPGSAYELGISQYSDPQDDFENGSIGDNNQGMWHFMESNLVNKIPYDKGYYAEFRVKEFSEFWLNLGGLSGSSALPVKLLDFTAQKSGDNATLKWKTGSENDVDKYEVEVARGNDALQSASFSKLGEAVSQGNTTETRNYEFIDTEADKTGPRYYRLKIINQDGSFFYSPVRSVVFDDVTLWQVFPNPSSGKFNLAYQLNANESIHARVVDAKGRILKEYSKQGNGFIQKLELDLGMFANGIYVLQVDVAGKPFRFKLYKQ